MKKPTYLEITEDELHWFRPSSKARRALRIARIKRGFTLVKKVISKFISAMALPVFVGFIYLASIHHQVTVQPKIPVVTLEMQLDYYQSIARVK